MDGWMGMGMGMVMGMGDGRWGGMSMGREKLFDSFVYQLLFFFFFDRMMN